LREAADAAVVGGEAAVLEHGGAKQVGGDHRDDEAGVGQRLLEPVDLLLPLGDAGAERKQVVIVEGESVGADLGEVSDGVDNVEVRPGRAAERVRAVVADGPQAEGEFVVAGWLQCHGVPILSMPMIVCWLIKHIIALGSERNGHFRLNRVMAA
jgi:hypothetical protein